MSLPPPCSSLTVTLFPYTSLFRSLLPLLPAAPAGAASTARRGADRPRSPRASSPIRVRGIRPPAGRARRASRPARRSYRYRLRCRRGGGRSLWRCLPTRRGRRLPSRRLRSRSEEHTSELQSLLRTSYAVFCLTKKQNHLLIRPHASRKI